MRLLRKALSICLSLAMVLAIFPALVVRAEIAELDTFTNINGTGISGVLYSDGRLVLSGNAKNGNFSLSSELKADTRLKYVDFSATTGIVTLNGGGFAGASIERFDFPESVKTVGSGLLQNCTHLKSVEFPAFLGENDATVYTSNFLKGTTALESVTIDFVMDSTLAGSGLLGDAGRPVGQGGLSITFGEHATIFNDLYFANNSQITRVKVDASSVSFRGRPFASAANLQVIDLSAVTEITRYNESIFQDIAQNSVVYLSERSLAENLIGSVNNTRDYGNGHYCSSRTGLVVLSGGKADELTAPQLPVLSKDGFLFDGYFTDNGGTQVTAVAVGKITEASFSIGVVETYINIAGTGLNGTLLSNGVLVLNGTAVEGSFALSSELKNEPRLRRLDFEQVTGLYRFSEGAFAGSYLESMTIPSSVTNLGGALFQNCVHLREVGFPSSLNAETAVLDYTDMLKGTSALEKVTIDFCMGDVSNNAGLLKNAGRSAENGGLAVVFGPHAAELGDRYLCANPNIVKVTVQAETISFNGQTFAVAQNLMVIDLTAVKAITSCAEGVFQNIGENSIIYVDTASIAQMFSGNTANVAATGNGHFCSLRTGIVVMNGAVAQDMTAPLLPSVSKLGYVFDGYFLADSVTFVTAVIPGRIIIASFSVAAIANYSNINNTGIDGTLYSDGKLVLSGTATDGTFSLSMALKDDARLKSIDFSGTTGIVTLLGGAFAESSIEEFTFPSTITTYGNSLFKNCRKLKRLIFPAFFDEENVTLYSSNFLNGTSALEYVEFHFTMSGAAGPAHSLLYGAGRPAVNGGLTVVFGEEVSEFNDLYFAENSNIVCVRMMADTVSFNGRPFASSRNLKIIDMSAVKSVSKNNEALFQDIGENSVVYLSSRDIASMFIGSENNTRSYGNGHYCASRTGLIVCRGAQIDIEYTDGRLPLLEKDGYSFIGYATQAEDVDTISQILGEMAIAIFTPGEAPNVVKTYPEETVGTGLEATLYSDGSLIVTGDGHIIKTAAFENEAEIRLVQLPAGITTIGPSAFAGTGLTRMAIPDTVNTIGAAAFQNCTQLEEITLGSGLTAADSIGIAAFAGTSALEKVITSSAPACTMTSPAGENNPWRLAGRAGDNGGFLLVLKPSVTEIGASFVASAQNLTKVVIESAQLSAIGQFAFSNCPNLRIVDLTSAPASMVVGQAFNWLYDGSVIFVGSANVAAVFSDGRTGVSLTDYTRAGQYDPSKTAIRRTDSSSDVTIFYPSYDFPLPENTAAPGDFYCPPSLAVGTEGCPVISGFTDQADPDQSITVEGSNFTAGDTPEVWVYAQTNVQDGTFYRAAVAGGSPTGFTATMAASMPYGMYLLYIKNGVGFSRPVRINAPRVTWLSADNASAGETITIYGNNLTTDNLEGTSYVYLRRADAGDSEPSISAAVNYADPYKVTFVVPSGLQAGAVYQIWLHNGHGGNYGWSEPAMFTYSGIATTSSANVRNVMNYGAAGDGAADDTPAIVAAIEAADSGDTIYFPVGTYRITQRIVVSKSVHFLGAGNDASTISIGSNFPITQNAFYYNSPQAIPTSFRDLAFVDTRIRSDTEAPAEIIRVHLAADASGNINSNGKINFRFEECRIERIAFEQSRTATVISYPSNAIKITYLDGISIQNNMFTCADALNMSVCSRMFIQSNQFYGNWVSIAGEFNAPCAIMICGNEKLDISGNQIYGRDALTDPQQAYAVGDETFGRAICMAGGNYTTWNVYIAKNDTKCIGNQNNNLGEQILFESGATLVSANAVSSTPMSVTFADDVDVSGLCKDRMIGILSGQGKRQYRVITSVSGQTVTISEPWTIQPDETSYFVAGKFYRDIVVYKNMQMSFTNVTDGMNASCGIGGPCNTVNLTVSSNTYSYMNTPVGLYSIVEQKNGQNLYDILAWAKFDHNAAEKVKNGFGLRVFYYGSGDTVPKTGATMSGILFRNNSVNDLVWSRDLNVLGGSSYAMALGTPERDSWAVTQTSNFGWIDGLVYENTISPDEEVGVIHLMKHHAGTILRNNHLGNDDVNIDEDAEAAIYVDASSVTMRKYWVVDGSVLN